MTAANLCGEAVVTKINGHRDKRSSNISDLSFVNNKNHTN